MPRRSAGSTDPNWQFLRRAVRHWLRSQCTNQWFWESTLWEQLLLLTFLCLVVVFHFRNSKGSKQTFFITTSQRASKLLIDNVNGGRYPVANHTDFKELAFHQLRFKKIECNRRYHGFTLDCITQKDFFDVFWTHNLYSLGARLLIMQQFGPPNANDVY